MILSCSCVHPETLLTRYLALYLTYFHQTYISDALWDERCDVSQFGVMVTVEYSMLETAFSRLVKMMS